MIDEIFNSRLKEPNRFQKFPKVISSRKSNLYCLKDKNNNIILTEYRKEKYSKFEISTAQFALEIARINSGL